MGEAEPSFKEKQVIRKLEELAEYIKYYKKRLKLKEIK